MKIKARRGVCIGVDRHLKAGDLADLDAAQVTFLVGIGAVEVVQDEPKAEPVLVPDEAATAAPSGGSEAGGDSKQESMKLDTKAPAEPDKKKK